MLQRLPRAARLLPVLISALAFGCGDDKTARVSGKVTFNGRPVPAGKIYFMPDGEQGNTGSTGYADIKDGEYDTGSSGGRNVPLGAVNVAIEGLDPAAPPDKPKSEEEKSEEATIKVLFPRYETKIDVSTSSLTKDFDVPASAAKGPTAGGSRPGEVVP